MESDFQELGKLLNYLVKVEKEITQKLIDKQSKKLRSNKIT